MELAKEIAPIVLAAVGATFLWWEVRQAHETERLIVDSVVLEDELPKLAEIEALMFGDRSEFLIRATMYEDDALSRAEVERSVDALSEKAMNKEWAMYAASYQGASERIGTVRTARRTLYQRFAPNQLRKRKINLALGYGFVVAGALMQIAVLAFGR